MEMFDSKSLGALAIAATLLGACSSTPVNPPAGVAAVPSATERAAAPGSPSAAAQPASTVATVTLPAHLDARSTISTQRSVYFDFDEFTVKDEFAPLLTVHGKYLAAHPELALKIEGNTDERGGSEYNLALGQRRAEAVLRALQIYGVNVKRIEAVSWGEERPKAAGHDEAAWAQNRRADLQYPGK
jgi:peptidoglycan-associated lipoprotein